MKKIIIIDGGPSSNMNTAQMLQKFAEGAQSAVRCAPSLRDYHSHGSHITTIA